MAHNNIVDLAPRLHAEKFAMIDRVVRARFVSERGARGIKPEQYPNVAAVLIACLQSMCLQLRWEEQDCEPFVAWLYGKCYLGDRARGAQPMAGGDATPEVRDYVLRVIEEGDKEELIRLHTLACKTDVGVALSFSHYSKGLELMLTQSWRVAKGSLAWHMAYEVLMLLFVARWAPDSAITGAKYSTNNVSTRDTRAAPDGAGRR